VSATQIEKTQAASAKDQLTAAEKVSAGGTMDEKRVTFEDTARRAIGRRHLA